MSNVTDALIAAKLVGGSGGSGGGSGESDIFVIQAVFDEETESLVPLESFDQCESAWNAGKVLFFAVPGEDAITESYYLVHVGIIDSSGISRFDATNVRILGGKLVSSVIQFNKNGTVSMSSNRYTLTPAN